MIDYGAAPRSDVIEVTLFGPGYGEAIAVHLGEGAWLLVDSCIDPAVSIPAAAAYLDAIGVSPVAVRAIVASHWHDDHVRGIARLARKYDGADFFLSSVFNDAEALSFLSAHNGASSDGLARGAVELYSVVKDRNAVSPAGHRTLVFDDKLNGRDVRVTALSPLPAAFAQFITRVAQYMPGHNAPMINAPELKPNIEAIALHVDLGDDAILLGADLEDHVNYGWSAVINDGWSGSRRRATAYKVAHHGSHTGDCARIWSDLLGEGPVACLTPFTLGRHKLPTETDKVRLRSVASKVYITSGASRRAVMDSYQLKRLGDICRNISKVNSGFGAVRFRKEIGADDWTTELFGAAQKV